MKKIIAGSFDEDAIDDHILRRKAERDYKGITDEWANLDDEYTDIDHKLASKIITKVKLELGRRSPINNLSPEQKRGLMQPVIEDDKFPVPKEKEYTKKDIELLKARVDLLMAQLEQQRLQEYAITLGVDIEDFNHE